MFYRAAAALAVIGLQAGSGLADATAGALPLPISSDGSASGTPRRRKRRGARPCSARTGGKWRPSWATRPLASPNLEISQRMRLPTAFWGCAPTPRLRRAFGTVRVRCASASRSTESMLSLEKKSLNFEWSDLAENNNKIHKYGPGSGYRVVPFDLL